MTKKARTILFSICAILFLLIAPSVVLYSQGYRIDFESKKIVQIGGFYFKVWPKNAQVLIDRKLKKKTDILFGSVFIENLLPKKYEIQIQKEGYLPWKKNLEIKEKMVTEAKNVVLIPENPKFTVWEEKIRNFSFSPNGKKIILEDEGGLKLLEIEREIKSYPIEDIAKGEIKNIFFSPDSQRILFSIDSKFKLLDLTKFPLSPIDFDFLEPEIQEISFNPRGELKIFFIKDGELFEANLEKKEIFSLMTGVLTYKISIDSIYYLDNSGFLFKTDFSQKIKEKINEIAFPIKDGVNYQLEIFGSFIFLRENEVLYLFNPDSQSFEKFFEPLKSLKISPDSKKIVYFSNFEIWLFFLEDSIDQTPQKAKEKVFLTRFSEKIEDLFWYTAHYLIFNTDSKIKIVEIDDRDRINIYDLAEFKDSKVFFNQTDKKIYLLSEGKLFVSEKLLP